VTGILTSSCVTVARTIRVDGIVQGVGFRPFVYHLARRLGITGTVRNEGACVLISARGTPERLEQLVQALAQEAPPLARVERVALLEGCGDASDEDFSIADSAHDTPTFAQVRLTPDAGICEQCEAELLDAGNRRHRHVFISCTDCGPRWSMLEALPYDRVRTTMHAFPLCDACEAEYRNPADRRFHAESVCCPQCGPTLEAFDANGGCAGRNAEAVAEAVRVLQRGGIVALHGIGGFHLAVSATDIGAVTRLRERKHRPTKPLAVMVRTIADADALVELDDNSRALLRRPERPVVIAPMRPRTGITPRVAPGLAELGVMLPSTALQHVLLHDAGVPLVMTSGNASGEPLAATPDDAWRDLTGIADLLLVHDRRVVAPSDDTVLRRDGASVIVMRRARGWSPSPVTLPVATPHTLLALGGDLKATVALAQGTTAWLSPHLGDQGSLEVQQRTAQAIARLVRLTGSTPDVVVCDEHPGYASTAMVERWAAAPESAPWVATAVAPFEVQRVQHHHAHVAAVMVEHGLTQPVVALAYDGAGWGTDGTIWGGEVLVADLAGMRRVGALTGAPLIGGDLAAREPWRAALGWLHESTGTARAMACHDVPDAHVSLACRVAAHARTVHTSSMGRLFDAAAAMLQIVPRNRYEGEAAARLEALAYGVRPGTGTPFTVVEQDDCWRLDPREALERLAQRARAGFGREALAAEWHDDVASTSVYAALRALDEAQLPTRTVVLCGGVFQNVRLLQLVRQALANHGVDVRSARTLPPNDGGLAIGQVAVAAALRRND
jgi:hydrogenase maturation protein HypF